jgi:AraC-like DNA-binding protein
MTASAALPLIDAAARGALLAFLLVAAWSLAPLLRWPNPPAVAVVGVAFMLSLMVQTLSSTPWVEHRLSCAVQAPGIGIALGCSVLFWLFACVLFDDGFRLQPWHAALWLAAVALGASICMRLGSSTLPSLALQAVMRGLPIVFAALAVAAALSQWRADLVEPRRRLRVFIVGAGALYAVGMVAARVASDGRLGEAAALADTLALLLIAGAVVLRLLRLDGGELWAAALRPPTRGAPPHSTPPPLSAAPASADEPAADGFDRLLMHALGEAMAQQRAYRQEGLTIALLAARLNVPEYRLRRVINQRLGHRNFNVYVNSLRLDEIEARLRDPSQQHLPVLTIALEAGFQSVGPFNRAFKARTGLTPTEFRKAHGAGGLADA